MMTEYSLNTENTFQQNLKIFSIYNIYRLVLSFILIISFFLAPDNSSLGVVNPVFFTQVTAFYILFNILSFFNLFPSKKKSLMIARFVGIILIDILVIILISYTCGGVSSGMAYLSIVPVATSSILFRGRLSIFLATIGTLSAMYSETYLYLINENNNDSFIQVALLGLLLVTISILLQYLGGRIRHNERLTKEQAQNIESLEAMNYQIIQRMQTGIIVVDPEGKIINYNSSTKKLLQDSSFSENVLPAIIYNQMQEWEGSGENPRTPFQPSSSSPKLQASFSYLNFEKGSDILIFLEDLSLLTSRAQHMKLMSLGRLTASIAHEVRNPLGAISHASQLLNESTHINEDDHRLLEIIENHSNRVNSIIENVLQLSRDKGAASELIPIQPWLDQFIEKFSSSYKETIKIDLELNADNILIRFNPGLLEQLLTNLCDNGIRYSKKKTNVAHLCIKLHKNPLSHSPVMDIIDDGEGVPPEQIENIFEPFFTTESSGTGLGLFICEEICEANQAQISYHLYDDNANDQNTVSSAHIKSCFRIAFAHPDRNIV